MAYTITNPLGAEDGSGHDTLTLSSYACGVGLLVVCFSFEDDIGDEPTVSFGGTSLTKALMSYEGPNNGCGIFYLDVTSADTQDIDIDWATTKNRARMYAFYVPEITNPTLIDTDTDGGDPITSVSVTLDTSGVSEAFCVSAFFNDDDIAGDVSVDDSGTEIDISDYDLQAVLGVAWIQSPTTPATQDMGYSWSTSEGASMAAAAFMPGAAAAADTSRYFGGWIGGL